MTIYFTIMLVLIAAITFFHWLQGFFSATISAILAIISATIAICYHEQIVFWLLAGRFAEQAHALTIIILFAVTYTVLRVIFDKAVPGNVRVPALLDKIGGGVMGLVAAFFATGVVTVAANSLPFGPTIAGYARFALLPERMVVVASSGQMKDGPIRDEIRSERTLATENFPESDRTSMVIPVDDIVVGMVEHLTDGGALAGNVPFEAIHPNYNDELFGNRIGMQVGSKLVAINSDKFTFVKLPQGDAVFSLTSVEQHDPEFKTFRVRQLPPTVKPDPSQLLLVVRTVFDKIGTDSDFVFRFSPASVRLVANRKNYLPIGVLDNGTTLYNNKIDDFLFVNLGDKDRGADLVFLVDRADVSDTSGAKINDGVFLEVKRMGRVDLSGKDISTNLVANADSQVLRHPEHLMEQARLYAAPKSAPTPKTSTPAGGASASPSGPAIVVKENDFVAYDKTNVSPRLFSAIGITDPNENAANVTFPGGAGSIRGRKWETLEVKPTEPLKTLADADYAIEEFAVPAGKRMVQVVVSPASKASNPWAWAGRLGDFELSDDAGGKFKPSGVIVNVKHEAQDKMAAKFSVDGTVTQLPTSEGRPTEIHILYLVPENATIRALSFANAPFVPMNLPVK